MSQIQRPTKQGGATTYQGKVSAGYTTILASEMDADLDTIYSAWNTGVDTTNIRDGSITGAKLAPGAVGSRELADGGVATVDLADAAVTTPKLADGAVTGPKIAAGSVGDAQITTVEWGKLVAPFLGTVPLDPRGQVIALPTYYECDANTPGTPNFDNTKPSWLLRLDYTGDNFELWRAPPPGTAFTKIFAVSATGILGASVPRSALVVNAPNGNQAFVANPPSFALSAPGVWTTVQTLPPLTTRGGWVHLHASHHMSVSGAVGGSLCGHRWLRNGAQVMSWSFQLTSTAYVPFPAISWIDNPVAGTWTYSYQVFVGGSSGIISSGVSDGGYLAAEIG